MLHFVKLWVRGMLRVIKYFAKSLKVTQSFEMTSSNRACVNPC